MNQQEPPVFLFNLEQNTKNVLLEPDVGLDQIKVLPKAQLIAVLLINNQPVNLNSGKAALSRSILELIQARGVRDITADELVQMARVLQGMQQPLPALVQPEPAPAAQPVAVIQPQPADQVLPLQDANARVLPDCVICWDNTLQCVFSRCGHLGVCRRCRDTLFRNPQAGMGPAELPFANCPVCRKKHRKQQIIPVYMS